MSLYNHTARLILAKSIDLANLKVMLVGSGYTFSATETDMTAATAQQVSGNGWASGGPTIANVAASTVTTNDAIIDGDDVSVTASGGDIGPADGLIVYDATNGYPLKYYQFASAQTAGNGTPFNVTWPSGGIIGATVA